MKTKIDELLAVLDMPEEEQHRWLLDNLEEPTLSYFALGNSLADLAFWLRDEANKLSDDAWSEGLVQVYTKCADKIVDAADCLSWFVNNAQPIHFIIAALIAKALEGEQK